MAHKITEKYKIGTYEQDDGMIDIPEKLIPEEYWNHKHRGVFLLFVSASNAEKLQSKIRAIQQFATIVKEI